MATYLFTWNPRRYEWEDIDETVAEIEAYGNSLFSWSCGRTRRIKPNDRFYLLRLGHQVSPKGIVGSGFITSEPYEEQHWNEDRAETGSTAFYVNIVFDALLNAEIDDILLVEELEADPLLSQMHWHPQTSGLSIRDDIAAALDRRWSALLDVAREPTAEELLEPIEHLEGRGREVRLTVYERNPAARAKCIAHYGCRCFICSFDFEKAYGAAGAGYIHVHHIVPVSAIKAEYSVNPIRDLRPVCPNCHAIIHRRRPPYSIAEVAAFLALKR